MKNILKRVCTGFLALATVITTLPATTAHAAEKQYWTESDERVGTQEEVFAGAKAFVKENKGRYECGGYIYSGEGQELGQFWAKLNVGNAKLQKVSSNAGITDGNANYSLTGATYGVFADKECQKQLATLTTDENGNTDVVEVKAGTVYIKELSAPLGFQVDTTVYSLNVEVGKTATLKVSDTPKVTDTLIELFKIDMETQKNNPQGTASLAGAEFRWNYYDGFYTKDNLPSRLMEHNEVKERISLLPIDVGKYSFRDKISGVMCMGVLGHLKRDEQEKLLYKLDKNLNINVPILIELLEPKFLVAPVGSRISVATQGRLRYETYITDIKQVGMDQWTWRLTYKVFCGKNIVSTVDSLMSWNYQSVEKILNQLTKMHFRTAKLSETLLLAIKAR